MRALRPEELGQPPTICGTDYRRGARLARVIARETMKKAKAVALAPSGTNVRMVLAARYARPALSRPK